MKGKSDSVASTTGCTRTNLFEKDRIDVVCC